MTATSSWNPAALSTRVAGRALGSISNSDTERSAYGFPLRADGICIELDTAVTKETAETIPADQRIAYRLSELAALGNTRQLCLQPLLEFHDQGLCFGLTDGKPIGWWLAPDLQFDRVEPSNAPDCFTGDR